MISIGETIEGSPLLPKATLSTAVNTTSDVKWMTSDPDPAEQPPVAVSVLADVIASTSEQAVPYFL